MKTLADRLNALAVTHGGEWSRTPLADGSVVVRLTLATGDVIAGTGATTAAATDALDRRVAAYFTAIAES